MPRSWKFEAKSAEPFGETADLTYLLSATAWSVPDQGRAWTGRIANAEIAAAATAGTGWRGLPVDPPLRTGIFLLEPEGDRVSAVTPAQTREGFQRLAQELNANSLFACNLRDREIMPTTMTDGFRQFVAAQMGVPLEAITAHFSAPAPMIPHGQFHKADQKPEAGPQQSFKEAVENSNLTEEQQQFLLSL